MPSSALRPLTVLARTVALALLALRVADAQSAAFATIVGKDTISLERYVRGDRTIEGDWITLQGETLVHHYIISLGADGRPDHVLLTLRNPGRPVRGTFDAAFGTDTVTIIATRDSGAVRKIAAREAFPFLGGTIAMLEAATTRIRSDRRDSATVVAVPLTGPYAARRVPIVFFGRDSARLGNLQAAVLFAVDSAGRIQGLDANAPQGRAVTRRVPLLDLSAYGITAPPP